MEEYPMFRERMLCLFFAALLFVALWATYCEQVRSWMT